MRANFWTRPNPRGLLVNSLFAVGLAASACSTPKNQQPYDPFAGSEENNQVDLFGASDEQAGEQGDQAPTGERYTLALPPAEMNRTIDGEIDDWNARDFRSYEGRKYITSGEEFWSGNADAGFKLGVHADQGYLYFLVEVRDDNVIDAGSEQNVSDGVIIWLQDPALADLLDAMPSEISDARRINPEVGILFTPDGQFRRVGDAEEDINREEINAQTQRTKNGYRIEAALSLGALEQVAELPLKRVAYRVELLDGDDEERPGPQTRMSTHPNESGARFAEYKLEGLLPFVPAFDPPPRPGGLGRWTLADNAWRFESFEVMPKAWRSLQDTSALDKALANADALDRACPTATHTRELVEAYQSTGGAQSAGLLICGPRAPAGRCPSNATTHIYWARFDQQGDEWTLSQHAPVTQEPLEQCASSPRPSGDLHSEFSLLPFEMLGKNIWGVGWTSTDTARQFKRVEKGIWFFNPTLSEPSIGLALSERFHARGRERTVSDSRVFLAEVDETQGLDICEIEHVQEQSCSGFNRSCRTQRHGETRQVHVQLWEPNKQRFEPYLQTKHRGCSAASFDFSTRPGYMLLHDGARLGVVASPANRSAARP